MAFVRATEVEIIMLCISNVLTPAFQITHTGHCIYVRTIAIAFLIAFWFEYLLL